MKYWAFHSNFTLTPTILTEIKNYPDILWEVQINQRDNVSINDKCILWISGTNAGIYAFGTIHTLPEMMGEEENRLRELSIPESKWPIYQKQEQRVKIFIDQKITDHPILRDDLPWQEIGAFKEFGNLNHFFSSGQGRKMIEIPKDLFETFKILALGNNIAIESEDENEPINSNYNAAFIAPAPVGPMQCPEPTISFTRKYPRNPAYSLEALMNSGFGCELEKSHTTFASKFNGRNFVEAHHLVPMNAQDKYKSIRLDVPGNIIALCPNCHRLIHLGEREIRNEKIGKLYKKRKQILANWGIIITLETLINLYNNDEDVDPF